MKTIHTSYKTFRFRIRERLSFIRTATRFWTMALVFVLSRTVANDTMSQYSCPIRSTVVAYVIRRYFRSVVVGGNREKILIVTPIQLGYQWNTELENSQCGCYSYCHKHETFLSNRQLPLTFIVIWFLPMQPESPILERNNKSGWTLVLWENVQTCIWNRRKVTVLPWITNDKLWCQKEENDGNRRCREIKTCKGKERKADRCDSS